MIKNIILASKSEIRKKVLEKEGFDVRVEVSSVDEDIIKDSMRAEGATSHLYCQKPGGAQSE